MNTIVPFERSVPNNKSCERCRRDCKVLTLLGLAIGICIGLATAAVFNYAYPTPEPLLSTGRDVAIAIGGFVLYAIPYIWLRKMRCLKCVNRRGS